MISETKRVHMNLSNVDGETPMDGVTSRTGISPEELSHLIHEVKHSRFRNGDKWQQCFRVIMVVVLATWCQWNIGTH